MDEQELRSFLSKWAVLESSRCRQKDDDRFEVLYSGQWLTIAPNSESHGAILAALFEGCHENQIYCNIEFSPRYKDELPSVQVGCIHRTFRWDEGEKAVYSIPNLFLTEYLEQLEPDETAAGE